MIPGMSMPQPVKGTPLKAGWFDGYKPPSKLHLLTSRLSTTVASGTTMYDSINGLAIPANAAAVAGYGPPNFAWTNAMWDRFPHALKVEITNRSFSNLGVVLDWETGNEEGGTPHGWIQMRKAAGILRPTIYCNGSTVPQVRQLTGAYLLGQDYDIWLADWTNSPHQYEIAYGYKPGNYNCPVVQYADPGPYDLSVIWDPTWPHVSDIITPPPVPTGLEAIAEAMAVLKWNSMGSGVIYAVQLWHGTADEPTSATMPGSWSLLTESTAVTFTDIGTGWFSWHVGKNGSDWTAKQSFEITGV